MYAMLDGEPFKRWTVEKSFDQDSYEQPIFDYIFRRDGLVVSDQQ